MIRVHEIGVKYRHAGRLRKPEQRSRALQRCHSTRRFGRRVFLQKRCAPGCQTVLGDFGSPRNDFHQILDSAANALKSGPGVVRNRFRRMNQEIDGNECD